MEYNIDIMSGIYDNGFRMVNSLTDFLNKKDFTGVFDKSLPFVIKKELHSDNFGVFFTFIHKGRAYHAYIDEIITKINSRPIATKFKIKHITALDIIYA